MTGIIARTDEQKTTARMRLDTYLQTARSRTEESINRIFSEVPADSMVRGAGLQFEATHGNGALLVNGSAIHDNALAQLSDKAGVPMAFVRALQAHRADWSTELLAHTLHEHAQHVLGSTRYLVRAIGPQWRAFLSDKFRRIDARPGLEALISAAQAHGALVSDAVVSDTRVSVRLILPRVLEISDGEYVCFGLAYGNSDYGRGTANLAAFILRLMCLNGAVLAQELRTVHLGARLSEDLRYSDRTMRLDAAATTSALKDTAQALLDPIKIDETTDLLRRAATDKIDVKARFVELRKTLGKTQADAVQAAYLNPDVEALPAGNTAWRFSNAISWVAGQKETSPEDRLDLERAAGTALLK